MLGISVPLGLLVFMVTCEGIARKISSSDCCRVGISVVVGGSINLILTIVQRLLPRRHLNLNAYPAACRSGFS